MREFLFGFVAVLMIPWPVTAADELDYSLPDPELLKAAAAGQLSTREQVAAQAERMLADPRARAKVREFFLAWLKVDQVPDLGKDVKKYPGFDETVASDLRTSLELFLENAFDERAQLSRVVECGQCFQRPYIVTNTPRTIGLRAGYKF